LVRARVLSALVRVGRVPAGVACPLEAVGDDLRLAWDAGALTVLSVHQTEGAPMLFHPIDSLVISSALTGDQAIILSEILSRNSDTMRWLAGRPDLPVSAAETIVKRSSRIPIRARAYRRIADKELLRAGLEQVVYAAAIAANPNTDPDTLVRLLKDGKRREVALRAACNPATPLQARREELADPTRVNALIWVSTPLGGRVVRSHELVLNNSWMLDSYEKYTPEILRAMTAAPFATKEFLDEVSKDRQRLSEWSSFRNHPVRRGRRLEEMTASELADAGSAAADIHLLERPRTTAAEAAQILSGQRETDPEPHVLGRLFRRYGSDPIRELEAVRKTYADTRTLTARWAEPCAQEYLEAYYEELEEARSAVPLLGTSRTDWEAVLALQDGWTGTLEELALAAMNI